MGSNLENQEQDEATAAEETPKAEDNEDSHGKDNDANEDGNDEEKKEGSKAPKEETESSKVEGNAATPSSAPATPKQSDVPTTPGAPMTPGSGVQQMPVQPYGAAYPPYPYYMGGYAPLPMAQHQPNHMMTNVANPYQYTDVANLHDPIPDTRRNRGGVTEPFPEKLHRMLEHAESKGLTDVVSFFSHGRAFAIHKPRRFVKEIMPKFFRQTRLTSFQRQLNLYGFRRISQGPDNGGYYHELFLKGRPGLCVNMKRTKVKGASKLKRDPDTEPNFYAYPPIKGQESNPAGSPPGGHASSPPPSRPAVTSPPLMYPNPMMYPNPPPPPYGYPLPMSTTAPYTAAQQSNPSTANTPVYAYPYPIHPYMYPPPPPPGHAPPASHASTPQTSPMKTAEAPKTPEASTTGGDNQETPDGRVIQSTVKV